MLRYGSICSGVEAATAAWHIFGWEPAWFSEIEPFPCAVLAHHYPHVPNHGDMLTLADRILAGEVEAPDLLVGGTPCQAFSVAGLRKGLDDERGKLTPAFALLADAIDQARAAQGKPPVIIVWENVPGVLSDKNNAYGCFLGLLSGEDCELRPPGGRWTNAGLVLGPTRQVAWRVLDAQYFGVAQRRRRVFVVASSRTSRLSPAQVLLVEQGMRRDSPPRREAGQGVAGTAGQGAASGGRGCGTGGRDGGGGGVEAQAVGAADVVGALTARGGRNAGASNDDLDARRFAVMLTPMSVRRLTPVECERLQGFPDDYTRIPWKNKPADQCPDGPRYKALGNSMAVPVMRWVGQKINDRSQP